MGTCFPGADGLERKRPHVVLQAPQLGDDVRRHDVRPRREQLAELDERRAELVEHLAEVLAAWRRLAVHLHRARSATRKEVRQLVLVEPVAEAVANCDLRDLGQPPEILCRRLRHRPSV